MVMSTSPARQLKPESALPRRATVLLKSPTPWAWLKIADTLSGQQAVGRLQSVCERWIYSSCLCFALDLAEQKLERVPLSVCQLSGRLQPQHYFRLRSGDGSGFSVLD